jgi:nucleoid-associated protein YgaU
LQAVLKNSTAAAADQPHYLTRTNPAANTCTMKSLMKKLVLEKKLVDTIKKNHPNKAYLYNLLCAGKITLQEYLPAIR